MVGLVERQLQVKEEREKAQREQRLDNFMETELADFRNRHRIELEKSSEKGKVDLFRIMSRHPDIFPVNNFSYLRKKLFKKSDPVVQKLSEPVTGKDRIVLYKKVREWVQKTMDVYERKIHEQNPDPLEVNDRRTNHSAKR